MAEGFVQTSATDANDLLGQIVSQAMLHGWEQHLLGPIAGGAGRRGHFSKDGVTVNLASRLAATRDNIGDVVPPQDRFGDYYSHDTYYRWKGHDILLINAGTGYDPEAGWHLQPDAPTGSPSDTKARFDAILSNGTIGRVYMFFYDNPAALVVVTEARPGKFNWLAAGNLAKDSAFQGGQFFGASHGMPVGAPRQLDALNVRVVDSKVSAPYGGAWGGSWVPKVSAVADSPGIQSGLRVPGFWIIGTAMSGDQIGITQHNDVVANGYDAATGRLRLHAVHAFANRADVGKSYLGSVPNLHFSTTSAFTGGDIVSIGGEDFMIFPANYRYPTYAPDRVGTVNDASETPGFNYNNHAGTGIALRKPA